MLQESWKSVRYSWGSRGKRRMLWSFWYTNDSSGHAWQEAAHRRELMLEIELSVYMHAIGRRTHSNTPCFRKSSNFMPPSAFDFSILRLQRRLWIALVLSCELSPSDDVCVARGQWHMLFWNEARLAVCDDDQWTAQPATIGCDEDCMPTCTASRQRWRCSNKSRACKPSSS